MSIHIGSRGDRPNWIIGIGWDALSRLNKISEIMAFSSRDWSTYAIAIPNTPDPESFAIWILTCIETKEEALDAWWSFCEDSKDIKHYLNGDFMKEKTLHNSDISGAKVNVSDLKVVGNGDLFQLLSKASSKAEGWMKSTKAMDVGCGCVVQVTTQQRNPKGDYVVAEAVCFVPGVFIKETDGNRELSEY